MSLFQVEIGRGKEKILSKIKLFYHDPWWYLQIIKHFAFVSEKLKSFKKQVQISCWKQISWPQNNTSSVVRIIRRINISYMLIEKDLPFIWILLQIPLKQIMVFQLTPTMWTSDSDAGNSKDCRRWHHCSNFHWPSPGSEAELYLLARSSMWAEQCSGPDPIAFTKPSLPLWASKE